MVKPCYCGLPMADHPACEACGILVGRGHLEGQLYPFRRHQVCATCLAYGTQYTLTFRGLSHGRRGERIASGTAA